MIPQRERFAICSLCIEHIGDLSFFYDRFDLETKNRQHPLVDQVDQSKGGDDNEEICAKGHILVSGDGKGILYRSCE